MNQTSLIRYKIYHLLLDNCLFFAHLRPNHLYDSRLGYNTHEIG